MLDHCLGQATVVWFFSCCCFDLPFETQRKEFEDIFYAKEVHQTNLKPIKMFLALKSCCVQVRLIQWCMCAWFWGVAWTNVSISYFGGSVTSCPVTCFYTVCGYSDTRRQAVSISVGSSCANCTRISCFSACCRGLSMLVHADRLILLHSVNGFTVFYSVVTNLLSCSLISGFLQLLRSLYYCKQCWHEILIRPSYI